ncbi:MAG: hypothetical protein SOX56_09540 [[Pasteurella] mairii]|uniref:Uncharacterized protein n=1 Tax=[Pasteurella] mairii TaxID=757 RepID=A0A379B426_9PAST|nr:hypothetical protein [[Pasteurella] mairii]SUB33357.1 Uncharacterised protein [[Pasteurella] mairii]
MTEPFTVIDENMKLQIHLKNDQPVQLSKLCESLDGISREYSHFVNLSSEDLNLEPCDDNIYVTQITKGSIIVELGTLVALTYPIIEHSNVIFEFGERLAKIFDWLMGNGEPPEKITTNQLRRLHNALEPTAFDPKGSISIGSININGDVHIHFEADSAKCNALQNRINKEIAKMKDPIIGFQNGCAMIWSQTATNRHVDKGIIEAFTSKPVKVTFDNDTLKETMVMREHPYKKIFIVDVMVNSIEDQIVSYHIQRLIDILDKDEI